MKKLLKEFKEFAMKGNVLDLAIAVVLGGAFGKVVTAVVEIFLNPIIASLPKIEEGGSAWTAPLVSFAAVAHSSEQYFCIPLFVVKTVPQ